MFDEESKGPPEENNYTVPTDPEVRRRIREHVQEAAAQYTMIDGYKDQIKAISSRAEEELEVPKRIFGKMVTAFRKDKFQQMSSDNEIFEEFYEKVMGDTKSV
jgi:adenosyl cobinamide kinase/adenosyl cobinamide phosphate guanylyltransferase